MVNRFIKYYNYYGVLTAMVINVALVKYTRDISNINYAFIQRENNKCLSIHLYLYKKSNLLSKNMYNGG